MGLCADCNNKIFTSEGIFCTAGCGFSSNKLACKCFKPDSIMYGNAIEANIPEEDQVQKKPDFLAKCMNISMVSLTKSHIEGIAELICDKYCKFTELIKNEDILHRICEGCPLNELMTYIQGGSKDD